MLGVLVFFHEWGHFIAAKLSGIRVEEFAFGFGPRLVRLFQRRETEYTIHAIPLGGFVKLTGMEPGEEDVEGGFQAQAIWKRAVVIFAGPLFSFILGVAVLLFVGVYWGFQDPSQPQPRVRLVQPKTEAARVDLRAGDRVLEINGTKITKGTQMTDLIHRSPGRHLTLLIDRDGKKLAKTATPRWIVWYLGAQWSFMNDGNASVESVSKPSAAARAGIQQDDKLVSFNGKPVGSGQELIAAVNANDDRQAHLVLERNRRIVSVTAKPDLQWVSFAGVKWLFPGGLATADNGATPLAGIRQDDEIVSINGRKITSGEDMAAALSAAKGQAVNLVVNRERGKTPLTVPPGAVSAASIDSGSYTGMGLLGFIPAPRLVKMGFSESIKLGLANIGRMVESLATTLTSRRIKEDVGGPVMIAKITQTSVAQGPDSVGLLLGSLSLSLAIINLVPIPAVLDGGHLLLLGIEAVRRKRWSRTQMQAMQMVGLAMIAVLIVLIVVSDITKIATGQVPQ